MRASSYRGWDRPVVTIRGLLIAPGAGAGEVLLLTEPLSLWGGVDPESGVIVDPRHPQAGACLAKRVVVVEGSKGSSSGSSVLAELARRGTAPAAFVLTRPDAVLAVGSLVAAELYGVPVPVLLLDESAFVTARKMRRLEIDREGVVTAR